MDDTEPADANGRDVSTGRFAIGNTCGQGNPLAKRAQELRAAFVNAVSLEDIQRIVAGMVSAAKAGDVAAARLVLDRCLGKVPSPEPSVAVQVVNNQPAEDPRGRALRIAQSIIERRAALFTGAGMEPPAELMDETGKSAREILNGFKDKWNAEDDSQAPYIA